MLALMVPALSLTNYEIGLLGSAQYIGVLCFVFLAGHLSDRYGRKSVLIVGLVVFTMFTWLIGFTSTFLEAFVFRLISGFGEGIFWPVAMAAVASYFKERKGLALGIFYVGFDAGSVAGLSLGGLAYSLSGDWRTAFFAAPSLGLIVIVGAGLKGKFTSSGEFGTDKIGQRCAGAAQTEERASFDGLCTFGNLGFRVAGCVLTLLFLHSHALRNTILRPLFCSSFHFRRGG